jgi:hypothetical protein
VSASSPPPAGGDPVVLPAPAQPEAQRRRRTVRLPRPRNVSDWRVRTKLAAVLVIPALAFTAIAGVQIASSVKDRTALAGFAARTALARQVVTLMHAMQTERDRTTAEMAGGVREGAFDAATAGDRRAVDEAYTRLEQAVAGERQEVRRAFATVAGRYGELREIRTAARAGGLRTLVVFDTYRRLVDDLLTLLPAATDVPEPRLSTPVLAFRDSVRATEQASQVRGLAAAITRAGVAEPTSYQALIALVAEQKAAVSQFRLHAPDADISLVDGPSFTELRDRLLEQVRGGRVTVPAAQWWKSSSDQVAVLRNLESGALKSADDAASGLSSDQNRRTLSLIVLILLVLAVAILTSTLIGRSMVRSLHDLRTQALDVARRRLPAAIERLRATENADDLSDYPTTAITLRKGTKDETGEVAEAFAAVHASALKLATEQAMLRRSVNRMIVSLARRSQGLVERQLRLLDDIEAAETDPDQLANLFRLDHLVTRMRRNDENLLVLTGADASRHRPEPVPLNAVVLAAMAEIEEYERVQSAVDQGGYVAGPAVADVVRLISELLENATSFSPPDSKVTVLARLAGDGSHALILIEDAGLGMSPKTLSDANDRLRNPGAVGAAAADRMGLLVAGRLAARHGIEVQLRSLSTGVQAEITLPGRLLVPPPARPYSLLAGTVLRRSMAHLLGVPGAQPARPASPAQPPRTPDPAVLAGAAETGAAARRATPTRAEDVLNAAAEDRWWSPPAAARPAPPPPGQPGLPRRPPVDRGVAGQWPAGERPGDTHPRNAGPAGAADAAGPPRPAGGAGDTPATPVPPNDAPRSTSGLPLRVPMAHLPATAAIRPPANDPNAPRQDPDDVSDVLTRFYSGVHRAGAEEPDAT